ncbi:hypothetical protein IAR55_005118 [Kwoniella newhampshirensis]|uniref:Uncharacterized protein n=1 Tax=Kwoniella newhampshirensis TaxID=1651941 RepID=A0AAW0YWJ2_9TREE
MIRPFASSWWLLAITTLLNCVLADTEIVNFRLPLSSTTSKHTPPPYVPLTILTPSERITIDLTASSPERWFILDFGESNRKSWTIRASWPGSSPTRIRFSNAFSPGYFVIHSSPLSPHFPHPLLNDLKSRYLSSSASSPTSKIKDDFSTSVHLTLEPLLLGVIPRTALPAMGLMILFALGAGACVPSFIRTIEIAIDWADQQEGETKKQVKVD